jgi:hypothetical protein
VQLIIGEAEPSSIIVDRSRYNDENDIYIGDHYDDLPVTKDRICSKIAGRCGLDIPNCVAHCKKFHKNVFAAFCKAFDLCICYFKGDYDIQKCTVTLGTCTESDECKDSCCNARCQHMYGDYSRGNCVDLLGVIPCVCHY